MLVDSYRFGPGTPTEPPDPSDLFIRDEELAQLLGEDSDPLLIEYTIGPSFGLGLSDLGTSPLGH